MRINATMLLMTIFLLKVSASVGYAQNITLHTRNATLTDVFAEIRKQTGFTVFNKSGQLKKAKPVTVSLVNVPLEEALPKILEGQDLDWAINEKAILIKEKEKTFLDVMLPVPGEDPGSVAKQQITTGRVLSEDNKPLPGATITVKRKGTDAIYRVSTDRDGRFTLRNVPEGAILVISYIGYESLEVKADKDLSALKLTPAMASLDEVTINKGYYTEKQRLSASSAYTVNAEVLERQPVGNFQQALEGRVPGLYLRQQSGVPGAQVNVELRGQNNLHGIGVSNNPLYIVDGVPFGEMLDGAGSGGSLSLGILNGVIGAIGFDGISSFNSLSMGDIENITILKDADATALYGSRGANGVILITTKRGRAGATRLDVNVYTGAGKVTNTLDLMNTQQYLTMRHEAFKNDGATTRLTDYDVNGTWDTTRYTDWQKVLIGNTSHTTDIQAALSGGNVNTTFRASAGYHRETTVYPGDFSDQKTSVLMNLNHTSSDRRLNAIFTANFVEGNNIMPGADLSSFIFLAPNAPALYTNTGVLNWQNNTFDNPLANTLIKSSYLGDNLTGNATISYEVLPELKARVIVSYNSLQTNQSFVNPGAAVRPNADGNVTPSRRFNQYGDNGIKTWNVEPTLNYRRSTHFGDFDALLGTTIQKSVQGGDIQSASGFSNDAQISNPSIATTKNTLAILDYQYRYNAVFGRIGYNYADKYLVNLTGRRDGSSRFGPGKQFGNFGAVGAAWVFNKENWMREVSWLSFGKLRASYGTTGSDGIPPYQYLSTYSGGGSPYLSVVGISPDRIANPYFSWQTVKKLEVGLDLSFIYDRINLAATYYRHRTVDQLIPYTLPSTTGFNSVQTNLPAVIQNSGLEIDLNTINIHTKAISWSTSFNLTIPSSKLISFQDFSASAFSAIFAIGQPISINRYYHYTGIDPSTGGYTFEDINLDGKISSPIDKQTIIDVAKNFFGGINNSFSYKNFHLDVFVQFVKQNGINSVLNGRVAGAVNSNQPTSVLDRWQNQQDVTNVPAFTQNFGSVVATSINNFRSSNLNIVDASFIRLKNVSLSYDLPQTWQHEMHLKNARIYVLGQNLLTWTDYPGLDPETLSANLPPIRMISLGLQVGL